MQVGGKWLHLDPIKKGAATVPFFIEQNSLDWLFSLLAWWIGIPPSKLPYTLIGHLHFF